MGRTSALGRASMLLSEPPLNPHIEAALKASNDRRKDDLAAALAIEPVISPMTEKLLLESMAWETGTIIPSTRKWKLEDKRKNEEVEGENAASGGAQEAAIGQALPAGERRASAGGASASTGDEWWSTASSDFGDATVSGTRGGSAPVGPIAWWPNTTVFKRRDSLVQLLNDKSISAEERKARRLTRSREREKTEVPREPSLHVKHYGKMCLQRSDQQLSFKAPETFAVVDTYHHPLRDRSLSELREREAGLRPENMDHNATLIIRERASSIVNPDEVRRTPKHAALYHNMAALPDLPTEARPVTVPSSQADLKYSEMPQPSLSLGYMRERTSLASRGASEHDLRQRDNLRKLDERMELGHQHKHTIAARHSFLDVERHVHRPLTEPTGTTADGRPVSSGPGYAIGSDRMPVHTGVVPQRWTVGRGKEQRLMDPCMWDEARELAEASRGSDRSTARQTSWKRVDTPDMTQQRERAFPGAEMDDLSAIEIHADADGATMAASKPESGSGTQKTLETSQPAPKQPEALLDGKPTPQSHSELAQSVAERTEPVEAVTTSAEPVSDDTPHLQSERASDGEAASPTLTSDQEIALHEKSAVTLVEEADKSQSLEAAGSAVEADFSIAALEAEFAASITPRASTPGSVGQWGETRELSTSASKTQRPRSAAGRRHSTVHTRCPDPQNTPHVGVLAGSHAPAAAPAVRKAPKPAEARAATLDPRSNRAMSAAAVAARRKGVWELSKQLRQQHSHEHIAGLRDGDTERASSRQSSLSSRSAEFRKGSRWSTLVADEGSAPDVREMPLALPGAFQGDPAARWWGSNSVLRSSRSRENMTSLSAVSSLGLI